MLLKHLSPTLDFIEFVFSCTQVKCGICHELLLRGQKEEHEKKCPGTRSKPLVLQRNISRNSASIGKLRQVSISQAIHDASSDMVNTPPPPKENSAPSAGSVAIKPPVHVVRKPTVTTASVPAPLTRNNIASSTTNGHSRPILKAANIKERVRQHEETPTVNPDKFYVGDRAEVGGRKGTVMFVGPAVFASGATVVGMRLDERRTTSACDGRCDGVRLFRCKAGFGIFVPIADCKKIEGDDDREHWDPLPGPAGSSIRDSYDPIDALDHIVGHAGAKEKIQSVVNALQVNRRRVEAGGRAEPASHMVLVGPPGSGKSMLARLTAYIVSECDVSRHGPLVRPSRADIIDVGRSPGRSAELIAIQCDKAEGGVLLIDDFHRMLPVADAGSLRAVSGVEALDSLALEVERRARRPGKGIVLIIAGDLDGIAAARRLCPVLDAMLPPPVALSDFTPKEVVAIINGMSQERGFALADGLVGSHEMEVHVSEADRCAEPTRRNAHLARSLLEAAINRQTERVFTLGTVGRNSLTVLQGVDFMGNSDDEVVGGAPGSVAQQMQDDTEKALAELENIVGLEGVKKFIKSLRAQLLVEKERIAAGLPSSGGGVLHMVFAGNPGTGKTTVARIIANLLRALGVLRRGHLVEADRSSLVAGYSGQTALKTKAVVSEALGGVLFVDEAYALVSGDRDSFGKEALDTLMKEIEDHREDLVVIAAGYINEMKDLLASNPGMESRFPTTLHFADYNADELMSIAERVLEPQRITLGKGARETLHAHFSSELQARHPGAKGSNGRGVRNLLEAAKRAQALRLADVKGVKSLEDLTTLTKEDCELACRK